MLFPSTARGIAKESVLNVKEDSVTEQQLCKIPLYHGTLSTLPVVSAD